MQIVLLQRFCESFQLSEEFRQGNKIFSSEKTFLENYVFFTARQIKVFSSEIVNIVSMVLCVVKAFKASNFANYPISVSPQRILTEVRIKIA